MSKRICWTEGMRLTDQILRASDDAELELIGRALVLGAAGQFGLFPGLRPFQISLNIGKETIDIDSLSCLAVTKNGNLIDVNYHGRYDNAFKTSVPFNNLANADEVFLVISILEGQWKETASGYEEPVYQFSLVTPRSPIPDNALPIGHLVNSEFGGWHVDDIDFVPPCLFVSSHPKYEELHGKFQDILLGMNEKVHSLINSEAQNAMRTFWPMLQQIMITTDKERDVLTPTMLLGLIQRYVCAFTTSCELDDNIGLSDAEAYYNYAFSPCNAQNVYQKIKEGVDICFSIREKMDKIEAKAPEPKPGPKSEPKPDPKPKAPYVADDQLYQNCKNKSASIPVVNPNANATVLYSTDGSEPSKKLPSSSQIIVENGFNKLKTPEPDKQMVVKLKAVAGSASSEVVSYTIVLHKDFKVWDGYAI